MFVMKRFALMEFYRGCQKNVPIEDRFSATNPYAAILFSEHDYDKRYKNESGKKSLEIHLPELLIYFLFSILFSRLIVSKMMPVRPQNMNRDSISGLEK